MQKGQIRCGWNDEYFQFTGELFLAKLVTLRDGTNWQRLLRLRPLTFWDHSFLPPCPSPWIFAKARSPVHEKTSASCWPQGPTLHGKGKNVGVIFTYDCNMLEFFRHNWEEQRHSQLRKMLKKDGQKTPKKSAKCTVCFLAKIHQSHWQEGSNCCWCRATIGCETWDGESIWRNQAPAQAMEGP